MEEIIIRYFQDNATAEEKAMLESWLKKNQDNQTEFESVRKTWDLASRLNKIHSVNVVSARKKVKRKIPEFRKSRGLFFYWQRIAAVIILPLMISVAGYICFLNQEPDDEIFQQTITSSYGTRNHLNLPDGTGVWLNSGSVLRFPSKFQGSRREVYLQGEAFFEVANDRLRPFYVNLGEMSVKAVGTSFNIAAYKKDNTFETTLISGELLLVKKNRSRKDVVLCKMEPNQHTIYDKSRKKITLYEDVLPPAGNTEEIRTIKSVNAEPVPQKVDIFENKYTSWINGKLIFRNDPMDEVIKRLGRWYNVDIRLQDTILYDFRYTATFIDETLEQVLELLKLSAPMEYTITEREINDDNSYTKKFVTIKLIKKPIN
jgi:ferric-dicitrate binding protein FerR (iron transport regulator)